MKTNYQMLIVVVTIIFSLTFKNSSAQGYQTNISKERSEFGWPEGKKMGLSLTFDDARLTQVDKGIPLLNKYGVKATFYLSPERIEQRMEGWKEAVRNGHEIGNHSLVHPCTVNFGWAQDKSLENYTLQKMRIDLDSANTIIKNLLGIQPFSFAFPCGQTYVGTGLNTKSYIPLVASLFETGRGWRSEGPNNPSLCDMAQLTGMEMDGKSFAEIKGLIESAKNQGQWLILAGHEMNEGGNQTTLLSTIDSICKYASDPDNGIWIDNVHNIASYVKEKRGEPPFAKTPFYKNPIYPIEQRVNDLLSRMTLEEKVGQLNMTAYPVLVSKDLSGKIEICQKLTDGTFFSNIGPVGGFWAAASMFEEGPGRQAEFLNELQKLAIDKTRLKIPLLFIEEGTHAIMVPGSTVFPEGLAIGSAWNMEMVENIYAAVAKEARARGIHALGTLVIEPNRDPRLGRNEEGYSEDPYFCSRIAEAIVHGIQGNDVSAIDKAIAILCHFPGQSEPVSGLERGAMEISERKLREVFLPPWVSGIKKAGALGTMATYPSIDGLPVHVSEKLLTKILRDELDFTGLVFCEGGGFEIPINEKIVSTMKESGELCIKAGVDVSIWHEDAYLYPMIENVKEGKVSIETIDRAVRRILRVKFLLGLFENPYVDVDRAVSVNNTKEHKELALQSAREGMVLLKNEKNLLPLDKNIKSIAVIGPNADSKINQLGDYVSGTILQDVATVLDGIKSKVSPQTKVNYVKGCEILGNEINEIKKAQKAAKESDLAVVVIGENRRTVGEPCDVFDLDLTGLQQQLVEAVYATGTPTIVVLINGRALSIRWIAENVPAVLEAWNCGEQGGNAVADVLFGDYNPGGKLPVSFPKHVGQLPVYYNYMPSKAYWINHDNSTYAELYVNDKIKPLYEFGYGLSYTSFEYSNLQITPKEIGPAGEVYVSVDVKNTGKRDGSEVVQLYIDDVISSMSTPVKELKGFEKLSLAAGETKTVRFKLTPEQLSFLDRNLEPVVEPGLFEVMIGSSSENIRLKGEFEVKR
jgi:beta-glucosidase